MEELRVLRIDELSRRLNVSKSTLRYWVKKNQFPRPITLGHRVKGWLEHDIKNFLHKRRERQVSIS